MPYDELMRYMHTAKCAGATDEQITTRLRDAGWYSVDVQDALTLYRKLTTVERLNARLTSSPAKSARAIDPGIIVIAVIAFVIGFLGYLFVR